MTSPQAHDDAEVADLVARAALGVEGVADLHGGSLGEVGTYLPGRRVTGVRVGDGGTTVHLVVAFDADLHQVADRVRLAVSAVAPVPVEVVVEDVATP
ncbi:hypothetical protein [Nocardioides aequoreus]|uniref:hypothetical protein n=1 Tax=Nocardioides aequoreus TaxID=397278 RepID=UPI0004C2C339|nr:hypothetical protein [Nocardioides aequoreus]